MPDIELDTLLNRDAIAEVEAFEKVATANGFSPMGEDERNAAFLLNSMGINQLKDRALKARKDSGFSNTLDDYKGIVTDLGFREVARVPFVGKSPWKEDTDKNEALYLYWRDKGGVLLSFDTYGENKINGGNLYYNWKPNNGIQHYRVTSSGGWECNYPDDLAQAPYSERYVNGEKQYTENLCRLERLRDEFFKANAVWVGYHDCREAIRHKINGLDEFGTFVTPWVKQPFMWLLHYMDTKDAETGESLDRLDRNYDYEGIMRERFALLPADVRAVTGEWTR
jgi:hypothetical protein